MTIITDPLFYLLALPAVMVLGLSKGGFAGVGQMATPLLALRTARANSVEDVLFALMTLANQFLEYLARRTM